MYGDSYVTVNFKDVYSYFLSKDKLGLMCVYKNYNKYDKSNLVVNGVYVTDYNNRNNPDDMIYIDYGTSILRKDSLENISMNTFFTTGDFFKNLIKKRELLAYEIKHRFYHIGNPEALEEFKAFIRSKGKP
jgi:NDP-sugar pyrophosphorylase family protein